MRHVLAGMLLATLVTCGLERGAGTESIPGGPLAGTTSPVPEAARSSARVERASQALVTAMDAAEQSKPKKPSFGFRRLLGLAGLILAARGPRAYGADIIGPTGAEWLVSREPATWEEIEKMTRWSILQATSEREIYSTILGEVDALAQVDGDAARDAGAK